MTVQPLLSSPLLSSPLLSSPLRISNHHGSERSIDVFAEMTDGPPPSKHTRIPHLSIPSIPSHPYLYFPSPRRRIISPLCSASPSPPHPIPSPRARLRRLFFPNFFALSCSRPLKISRSCMASSMCHIDQLTASSFDWQSPDTHRLPECHVMFHPTQATHPHPSVAFDIYRGATRCHAMPCHAMRCTTKDDPS